MKILLPSEREALIHFPNKYLDQVLVGLPDLVNINTEHPVKFEIQIHNKLFSVYLCLKNCMAHTYTRKQLLFT